jgi:branched-subunit amino acid transport protein AzlD
MLKLQPIEFFLRTIPEGFLFILAIYVFSEINIDRKKYIISSLVFSSSVYIIRLLPINYGVHMILSVLVLLFISIAYNKVEAIQSVKSIIILYMIQLISEAVNVLLLNLMKLDLDKLFKDPIKKSILGLPSLLITLIIIIIFYLINKKRRKLKK